ncbi:MAG: tRNA1(Val) (adenine(37)-N6)-methyltransferase [Candidatus Puniceispirillaceae bacterium]
MTINVDLATLPPLPEMALSCDGILNRQYHLYQPKKGYRFGTDAIMLAAAIAPYYGERLAEFGAGAGAVSFALSHFHKTCHITAIEKDTDMAACLRHNIARHGLSERIRAMAHDITDLPPMLLASFDCVVANPPFHHPSGTRSRHARRALAHHGDESSLDDWITAGLSVLKPKGRLVMILRADRADDVIISLREKGAGGISLQPLWPYQSSPAIRVIITAQKDSSAPFSVREGLVLHHPDGALTGRAQKILSGEGSGFLSVPEVIET